MLQNVPRNKAEIKRINPVVLAFVGDAVYSLFVRAKLSEIKDGKPAQLQRAAANVVSAKGQSSFLADLLPLLTEEEEEIYRRGRNAKKGTKSKNASAVDYNRSTGLEAVFGYLYLTGENVRLNELLSALPETLFVLEETPKYYKP
jgi:ribonuclease-3 family protein